MDNVIVNSQKNKTSGSINFNNQDVDLSTIADELALLNIGDWEPLKFKINCNQFKKEIKQLDNEWVDYLPRTDRPNNRLGMAITNLPGMTHQDNPSLAQACISAGRRIREEEFNEHTMIFDKLPSLHNVLDTFEPLGRTFLVRCGIGGHFYPHRDHHNMPREAFRLIAFLEDCSPHQYDWIHDNKIMPIEEGRVYYVNTRKIHRTMSWAKRSTHLIINVPFNSINVQKVLANLR